MNKFFIPTIDTRQGGTLKRSVTTLRGGSLGYAEIVAVKVFVHLRHSCAQLLNYSILTTMLLAFSYAYFSSSHFFLTIYGVLL